MTSEQGFNCVFCEDVFDNKEDLQVHFRKHGDPGFNKKNKCRITNDSEMASVKPTENVEMVGCDVCSEVFTTISKAITHKHKIHPDHDAKYFCPWCGKLFTMKHLYNKHMQSNHNDTERPDDKDFHCDCCDVDFYIPSAVTYHNKFFHRQDTDLPDIGQSKKLKLHNGEAMPIYYCAFCGEEYDNKVNLYKHTTDDHSDENQSPEEVLRCPLCEAIFYHLDAYEVHLTFHTTDDLYSTETIMCGDLHEYSLESLPPVLEKVENLETQGDAETTINSVGIDKFLELTMDQSQDSASVKSKKHKKHKKSKKSAITLDEFLSMNKDVFGEGLDFQGIEEVPTRVVTKRLKSIKKPINTVSPLEIEKLKQQGIVVKKKVSQNPKIHGIKVLKGISEKPRNIVKNPISNKMKPAMEVTTSEEVLSKLLTQSNNEIKIVKKSIQDNIKPKAEQSPTLTSVKDDKTIQKVKAEYGSGEEENINDKEDLNKISSSAENNTTLVPPTNTQEFSEPISSYGKDNSICETEAQMVDQDNQSDTETDMVRTDVLNSTNSNLSPNQENSQCNVGMLNINMNTLQNKTQTVVKSKANEIVKSQINQDNYCFLESNQKDNVSDNEADIDEIQFDNLEENKVKFTMPSSTNTSLSALKNLNHNITIKPLNQTKITTPVVTDAPVPVKETDGEILIKNQVRNTSKPIALPGPVEKETVTVKQNNSDPNLDALKKLRKNITIKSYSKHVPENSSDEDETEAEKETENITSKEISAASVTESKDTINKNINSSQNEPKFLKPLNSSNIGYKASSLNASKINIPNSDNCIKAKNDNILKRLPNITTKPVTSQKVEQIICKPSIIPTKIINQQNEGEIEIFNIDDSDDDENENNLSNQYTELPTIAKPVNALKKLNKNITIKSVNQQSIQSNIKIENNMESDEEHCDEEYNAFMHDSDSDDTTVNMKITKVMFTKSCSEKLANKNISIKNALQTLGKNITVKSRNSSPNLPLQEHSSQDSNVDTNEGSDSDSNSGKVKITEMDEHASDDEMKPDNYMQNSSDAIVQSPDASGSEDNEADFENEIKASTVQKQQLNSKNPILINTLKNLGKNITIKSLSEQNDKEDKSDPEIPDANFKKQMPIKQSPNQNQSESAIANKNSKRLVQADLSSNQSVNQKMSMSSSNQVNTVNKEVTVKTFQTQTKTVIQEITTTVTKTIKTVNQTTKQEIQNSRQINSPIKTQRIQGMRPNQSNNLQGIVVRHASPLVGTKMGNSSTQIRTGGTMIRPSKQIVPVRPGLSGVRPSTPRLPVVRKPIPVASPQNQVIGRPLKISPNALTTTPSIVKRHSEDLTGPFSCFKKPKESLIPVSEASGETIAQYASTAHCSTSNSTSTIKVVKGNSVVTSTQMKSEMCSNAQQISRLSNNSGLKVVKTSQAKQQQTQEKSETNAMKRTTLAAIEKLQKQGLLVKKPRLDVSEDSEHSDIDDENLGYSSNEEQN